MEQHAPKNKSIFGQERKEIGFNVNSISSSNLIILIESTNSTNPRNKLFYYLIIYSVWANCAGGCAKALIRRKHLLRNKLIHPPAGILSTVAIVAASNATRCYSSARFQNVYRTNKQQAEYLNDQSAKAQCDEMFVYYTLRVWKNCRIYVSRNWFTICEWSSHLQRTQQYSAITHNNLDWNCESLCIFRCVNSGIFVRHSTHFFNCRRGFGWMRR